MCIPLAAAALIMAAVGTATATYGAVSQGENAKEAADANAKAQRATAISAENVGAQQAADAKLKAKRVQASGITAAAAGGIDPATGTPLTLSQQTAEFGELDSLRIINNASRTAWGYQAQANITESQGKASQTAGYISGASTLLGGASKAYFGGQDAGLWGEKK